MHYHVDVQPVVAAQQRLIRGVICVRGVHSVLGGRVQRFVQETAGIDSNPLAAKSSERDLESETKDNSDGDCQLGERTTTVSFARGKCQYRN